MNCQDMQDHLLTDFADHEIGAGKKRLVEAHLAACQNCREFFAAVLNVDASIKEGPLPEGPAPHVWAKIADEIHSRPHDAWDVVRGLWEDFAGGFRPRVVYGSMAAAMLVALVVVVPLATQREQAAARADREELLQLAYADDENPAVGWDSEQGGTSLVLEHWL